MDITSILENNFGIVREIPKTFTPSEDWDIHPVHGVLRLVPLSDRARKICHDVTIRRWVKAGLPERLGRALLRMKLPKTEELVPILASLLRPENRTALAAFLESDRHMTKDFWKEWTRQYDGILPPMYTSLDDETKTRVSGAVVGFVEVLSSGRKK